MPVRAAAVKRAAKGDFKKRFIVETVMMWWNVVYRCSFFRDGREEDGRPVLCEFNETANYMPGQVFPLLPCHE